MAGVYFIGHAEVGFGAKTAFGCDGAFDIVFEIEMTVF